jgi:glycosyltransferase involved in cell wall biosynthesis
MNISIIIPLYNKEKFIERCLNSIFSQTLKSFEVIIVDDGSTDKGADLIREKFSKGNLRLITQENSGVSKARNTGVSVAKYSWVAFLDADDYWEKDFLLEISNTVKLFPNVSLCSSGYQFLSGGIYRKANLRVPGKSSYRIIDNYFRSSCDGDLPITASSVVIKKSDFLKIGGFPEDWNMGEDIYVWMKMSINFQLAICTKTLVTYDHSDENSATKNNLVLDILPHVNALEDWLKNDNIPEHLKKHAAYLLHRSYIYTAFQNIKYGSNYKAATLISSPNVFNGWHKLVIKTLTLCPDWLIKRLN